MRGDYRWQQVVVVRHDADVRLSVVAHVHGVTSYHTVNHLLTQPPACAPYRAEQEELGELQHRGSEGRAYDQAVSPASEIRQYFGQPLSIAARKSMSIGPTAVEAYVQLARCGKHLGEGPRCPVYEFLGGELDVGTGFRVELPEVVEVDQRQALHGIDGIFRSLVASTVRVTRRGMSVASDNQGENARAGRLAPGCRPRNRLSGAAAGPTRWPASSTQEILPLLKRTPQLRAVTIFEALLRAHPGLGAERAAVRWSAACAAGATCTAPIRTSWVKRPW